MVEGGGWRLKGGGWRLKAGGRRSEVGGRRAEGGGRKCGRARVLVPACASLLGGPRGFATSSADRRSQKSSATTTHLLES
eukprot:2246608-Prymnesium_polylepis.1